MSQTLMSDLFAPSMPGWVPETALRYLAHTETGLPIRALARAAGCHASTVLRQIRKLENRRDDQLVDEALRCLGHACIRSSHTKFPTDPTKEPAKMTAFPSRISPTPDEDVLNQQARRILRRLSEPGAVLAVASEMDKAVVVRDSDSGTTTRTAVVDRAVAQAMALNEWITCDAPGRISRYRITSEGRATLARLLAEAENQARQGFAEAQAPFAGQHRVWDTRQTTEQGEAPRRQRYNAAESPLTLLARRRDKDGTPFLSDDLVAAGERLREDFELSQMGPNVAQNWDRFLTGGDRGGFQPGSDVGRGSSGARDRVAGALRDLGPGLGDVVLRCCCYLEGLESAEKRMGWSARSGKIVLRIALQRLKRHYQELGQAGAMIG
ncbi:DUF6456 domain-containing protein [Thalassovita taeanensis]|uniref:DUF6456 domain-containing protein n=1 Tax=Thalassovita taeanensis TaxID=657014 RepID=A0A1H8Z7N0_9RHOB|nr:DUF6456 domain-containing protein [Thalassovita taeanensis]SEP60444.1 hypothetical protein SAMN04488092_101333 [Thalassovita taeanensis]